MENIIQNKPFELTNNSLNHLSETRKWTLFMSILGFIFIGLCIIGIPLIVATSAALGVKGSGLLTIVPLILFSVLYFFPIYYLFKFSSNSKKAILNTDGLSLEIALKYLKFHYRFMGILFIVAVIMYFVIGLVFLFHFNHKI
jgi:hypothetical protein